MGWLQKENREHSIRSYLGHLKVGFMERLRFGSILGPLLGSLLLAMQVPVQQIFFYCAIPAVMAALLIIQVRSPQKTSRLN